MTDTKSLAVVTGASSGICFELARQFAVLHVQDSTACRILASFPSSPGWHARNTLRRGPTHPDLRARA